MDQHIRVLGILHIAWNLFTLVVASCALLWILPAMAISGDDAAVAIGFGVFIFVGAFVLLFTLPGIIGGVGILYRQSWARILLLIVGAISLFNFPFGTALGIYTFWVLLNDETSRLLT